MKILKTRNRSFRSITSRGVSIALLVSLISVPGSILFSETAAAVACSDSAAAQNGITVTPSQGKAFYIDSGQNQNIDAAYVGYRVKSSSARKGIWVKLSNFTGGVVGLANPLDSEFALDSFAGNDTRTAYFLLKAQRSSTTAQTHTVTVYDGRPDVGTPLYSCTYTFTRVTETIKANPNKITSVDVSAIPALGGTFTVTVLGNTGTIGAGKTPDYDSMWFTPASTSTWPTRAMRLEKVEALVDDITNLKTTDTCGAGNRCFTDQLLIPNLKSVATSLGGSKLDYWVKYTFRVIGSAPSVQIKPIAQISSGNQMKHTPLNGFTGQAVASVDLSAVSLTSVTVNKVVNATTSTVLTLTGSGATAKFKVPYKVTVTNNGTSAVSIDKVIDIPDSAVDVDTSYTPTTAFYAAASGGSPTSTGTLPVPTKSANGEVVFSGPLSIAASGRVEITYQMLVPQCPSGSGTQSYSNKVYASIGSTTLGSSTAGFMPSSSLTTSCSSTTNLSAVPPSTNVQIPIEVITNPATSITNTDATLNGSVDSNGQSGQTISFEWGTTSALGNTATASTTQTTSSTNPIAVTAGLTGLSSGTIYYFRVRAGSVLGEILTFVTTEPVAAPTVVTDPPTNVSTTNATLNGTIDPNQTAVYVEFQVWRNTDTVTVRLTDDPTIAYNSSSNAYVQLSSAFPTQVSLNMSDYGLSGWITSGVTIYYKVRVVNVSGGAVTTATQTQQFTMTTYTSQTITFNAISDITFGDTAPTIAPTASSGMAITYGSGTSDVCTVSSTGVITIIKSGICTITTDQSGGLKSGTSTYYDPAIQVVQSFNVNTRSITITADAKSKQYGDSDPTLTYAITSGSLVSPDTFTGTLTRATGETPGTYLISQGSVSAGTNYSVTYVSANLTITNRAVTITAAAKTKVYGDADPGLTYSITSGSLATGDAVSGALHRATGNDVGTYLIDSGTVAINSNYTITYVSANFTITKKTLTLTVDNKAKRTTDTDPTFTYAVTAGGLVGSDTLTGTLARPNTSNVAGSYSIETGTVAISGPAANNYNFSVIAGTLTVTDKVIPTLLWNNPSSIVYGTLLSGTQLNAITKDGATEITSNCVYTPVLGTMLDVGPHTLSVTCTPTNTTLYSSVSGTVTITVTGKPITVQAANKSKQYGNSDPTLTWRLSSGSLESGDTLTGTLSRTTGEDVGSYSILQGTLDNTNYIITYVGETLTVTSKSLTVSVTAGNKQYDRNTNVSLTFGTLSGVLSADSGNVTLDSSKITGVFSDYNVANGISVTLSVAAGVLTGTKSSNYNLTSPTNPTANITKATATVTAANKTVTAGQPIGTISYTVSGLVAGDSGDPFTGISCSSDYDSSADDSTTVRYTSCSGGTSTNYTPTYVDGSVTINDPSTTTYSVTYTNGGGSGTLPTQSPLAAGASFTLGSGSGLSRSGYTFAGWSCNSGSTQSAGSNFTMPSSALTCVAQWTSNSSGSSGGSSNSASSPGKSGSTPAAARKVAVVTLVTVATTPVKATAVAVPSTATKPATPSTGGTTGSNSGSTTPGNSGSTPSTPATPSAGGTVPEGSTNQNPISVANTKLSQTTTLTTSQNTEISFKGNGVTGVTVKGDEVAVAARPGFSGKTTVTITLTKDEEVSQIMANVIVLPLPVTNPIVKPVAEDKSRITWVRSPNATGYEVIQDGKVICTTAKVTCTVPTLIAPEAKVEIKALGRDQTESLVKEAKYVEAAVTTIVPEIALVVNFDTAKYNLDAGDKALIRAFAADIVRYGYTKIDISGHTDSRGGIDNNVLSNNRAKASRDYLLSLLPNLKVTINGFADAINVATNSTTEGMAANRRAEFRVIG